jgi:hypothetical protein
MGQEYLTGAAPNGIAGYMVAMVVESGLGGEAKRGGNYERKKQCHRLHGHIPFVFGNLSATVTIA